MLQAGRSRVRVLDEVYFFSVPNPSSRTMALGSTQPLTEMSIRKLPGGKKRPALTADNLPPSMSRMSENVGASASRNPKGLHGPYRDNFTFTFIFTVSVHKILSLYLSLSLLNPVHNLGFCYSFR
jgi:hypothetical protein